MSVNIEIKKCSGCPYKDHSGQWTPGGARNICGHYKARITFGNGNSHWEHRVLVNGLNASPPEQCPLRLDAKTPIDTYLSTIDHLDGEARLQQHKDMEREIQNRIESLSYELEEVQNVNIE